MDNEVRMVLAGEICPCGELLNGDPLGFVRYCSLDCMPAQLRKSVEGISIYEKYLIPGEVGTEQEGMTQEEHDLIESAFRPLQ